MTLHAAAMKIELRIREARSLKAKRSVLQSLLAELRNKYSLSAAEIAHQDEWQRSTLGIALVGSSAAQVDASISTLTGVFDLDERVDVVSIGVSYLEDP